MFVEVKIVPNDSSNKVLKPIRINMDLVVDYREWVDDSNEPRTVFYFTKEAEKSRLVVNASVEAIDKVVSAIKLLDYE